ncbi:MAG TPA: LytTR family DNA-binding domain-containing protein [Gemmatimonadaceae bacterium]|nr:LytTR family DNA-binding domain-containing protein [Gemmatimonadaceae bacterium]
MPATLRREMTTSGIHRAVAAAARRLPPIAHEGLRLVVKHSGGVTLLRLDEIECLEADGNVVVVHTCGGDAHRLREPLGRMLERLGGHGFIRIHRGIIVRAGAIAAIEKGSYRKAVVILRSGVKREIGRAEFHKLRSLWQPGVLDLQELSGNLHLVPMAP